jgi:hypothetical protein
VVEAGIRIRRAGAPFVLATILLLLLATGLFFLLGPATPTLQNAGDLAKTITAVLAAAGTLWAGALVAGRFLLWDSARGARLYEQSNTNPMQDVADHFAWLIRRARRPVVFLIDDLDRCPEGYVVELLDTVQTLIRDAGKTRLRDRAATAAACYFAVAADGCWIRTSYEIAYGNFVTAVAEPGRPLGYLFLDKLFQLRVPVPGIGTDRQQQYLRGLLGVPDSESAAQTEAEDDTRARLRNSTNEAQIVEALREASLEIRARVTDTAIERLTASEVEAATEHSLQIFGPLLPANPRSMKRFVNVYSALRTVRTLEGHLIPTEPLALWAVLEIRWPGLADYLRCKPDAISLVGNHPSTLTAVPAGLRDLFNDPALVNLVQFEPGGPLTGNLIQACCGAPSPEPADVSDTGTLVDSSE